MPTISKLNLTVTLIPPFDDGVKLIDMRKLTVKYTADFTSFELGLVGLGVTFQEQITIMGVDAGQHVPVPGGAFPAVTLPVQAVGPSTIKRSLTSKVTRDLLQEDPSQGDNDEICCRIRIVPIGLPSVSVQALTNQVSVGG